jgi:hypothetical protein
MKCLVLTKLTTKKKDPTSLLKNNMKHPTKCYKKLLKKPQLKYIKYEGAKQITKCQKEIAISSP